MVWFRWCSFSIGCILRFPNLNLPGYVYIYKSHYASMGRTVYLPKHEWLVFNGKINGKWLVNIPVPWMLWVWLWWGLFLSSFPIKACGWLWYNVQICSNVWFVVDTWKCRGFQVLFFLNTVSLFFGFGMWKCHFQAPTLLRKKGVRRCSRKRRLGQFGAPSRLLEKQIKIVDVYCANVLEREWTWKLSDA